MFESEAEARLMGRHSNIPECCIEWYVTTMQPLIEAAMYATGTYMSLPEPFVGQLNPRLKFYRRWRYWPCPECLLTGYAQRLHLCTRRCRVEFRRMVGI